MKTTDSTIPEFITKVRYAARCDCPNGVFKGVLLETCADATNPNRNRKYPPYFSVGGKVGFSVGGKVGEIYPLLFGRGDSKGLGFR